MNIAYNCNLYKGQLLIKSTFSGVPSSGLYIQVWLYFSEYMLDTAGDAFKNWAALFFLWWSSSGIYCYKLNVILFYFVFFKYFLSMKQWHPVIFYLSDYTFLSLNRSRNLIGLEKYFRVLLAIGNTPSGFLLEDLKICSCTSVNDHLLHYYINT